MKKSLLLSFIFVLAFVLQTYAQSRTVTGRVTSAVDGSPLPGVTVLLKGSSTGVNTDIEGDYSITVPASGGTLVFSFLGLQTKEVAIGNQQRINVSLNQSTTEIAEVVVTGYIEQDVKKLTGAVSTVNSAAIEQVPIASFEQILQGRAAGLQVSAGSGQPGSTARVRIRGNSSINGSNQPLYILDGVPIDPGVFATMNPNDFETVSILKDASSTALYGSRASNGVILLTSKRGKAGRTQVMYRTQFGVSTPTRNEFTMMNTEEKILFERQLFERGTPVGRVGALLNRTTLPTTNSQYLTPAQAEAEIESLKGTNTDWFDEVFRNGRTQSHEVNARGGDAKTRFYISGAYFDQEGIATRSGLERYTGRFNIDHDTQNKLRFGLSSTMGYSTSEFIESEGAINLNNIYAAAYLYNPYERIRNPETGEYETPATGINVFERTERQFNENDELKGVANTYAELDLFEGLTLRTLLGIDYRSRTFDRLIGPTSSAAPDTRGGQGSLNQAWNRRVKLINTNTANYSKTIGDRHYINFLLGNEILKEDFRSTTFTGYGINPKLLVPAGITPGTATNGFIPLVGGTRTENGLVGFFGNLVYSLDGKYNLSGSLRRDGSSKFGANNRWATFYSVGASWNISEESFLRDVDFVSNLKIRLNYGTTGNQDLGTNADFPSLGTFGLVSYEGVRGIAPSTPENPDLRWEKTGNLNFGVDFGIFNDRLNGSVELYNNKTKDLFINTQLSRTSGFTSLQRNVGEMRNRGVEVTLNADIVKTKDFLWSTTINFAYNQNEILDLFQEKEFILGTSIVRVGLPLGTHFQNKYAGVNPANGEALYYDVDGNITNMFSADDKVPLGTFNPPVTGGFNSTLAYKGLDLSAFFSFVQGNQLFNNNTFFITNTNFASFNQRRDMLNAWKSPGDVTNIPALGNERQFSSFDLEDGSYLRLRNLTLSYSVPSSLTERVKLNSVRAFVQAQNLYTWTNFTGFDPEIDNNIQQFNYPVPRTYTFGFDIGF